MLNLRRSKVETDRPDKGPNSILVQLVALSLALVPALTIRADEAKELADKIPSARIYSAMAWTGTDYYILGGELGNGTVVKDILKYTPSAGGNATKVAELPQAVHSTALAAVWNGSAVFIFGGTEPNGTPETGKRIVAYTPANNTAWNVSTALFSSKRQIPSVVWTGEFAYIIGGLTMVDGTRTYVDEVVRFNTTSFALDVVLNSAIDATSANRIKRASTSAIWDGSSAYIFGGNGCPPPPGVNGDLCAEIIRYTPSNNTAFPMASRLWTNRSGTAAAYDGLAGYIFGDGTDAGITQIIRYRPDTDTLTNMSASLPTPRGFTNAVWNGTSVYVMTGRHDLAPDWPESIVRYNLTPGKPLGLLLDSGNGGPIEINSTWVPPASDTYTHPITNYTLYRNPAGFSVDKVIRLGNVTSHSDSDGLTHLTTYCYNVTATNPQGEGPPYPGLLDFPKCAVAW